MSKKDAAPEGPKSLSRDAFFAAATPLAKERIPVPEKGGYVCMSVLSASRRDLWEASTLKRTPGAVETDYSDYRAKAVALSMWDETRNEWACTLADAVRIGAEPAPIISRLFDAFVRLNAIRDEDLKELEKLLEKGQPAAG